MADTKAPELPEGWDRSEQGQWLVNGDVAVSFTNDTLHVTAMHCGAHLSLPVLRALLSAHGLAIVNEADKRVLDAMWAIPDGTLTLALRGPNARCQSKLCQENS